MDLPARIGRYDVVRLLGQGGMGRVLLARDSVLGRSVAIKVLRDDLGLPPESREALFDRMRVEARAAATLEHPHMVTLHDMGEEAPHGLFLVFEYVDGPTLRDQIAKYGRIDLALVARLARELGDALTSAHDANVIHRDVKPENVMLSKYGAKLTDFGIARIPDSNLTRAGTMLGTPAYSAPEALASADFSPLSDQFSLAVTLYEAISGKRAFPGDDTLTVATRVAAEPAAPLALVALGDGRLLLRVDQVLARAMSKEPGKRYVSCRAMGDALADAIEAPMVESLRVTIETPMPKSIVPRATRRVQNMIAAAAAIVIVALLLMGRRQPAAQGEGVSLRRVSASFASAVSATHTVPAVTGASVTAPKRATAATRDAGVSDAGDAGAPGAVRATADASVDDAAND